MKALNIDEQMAYPLSKEQPQLSLHPQAQHQALLSARQRLGSEGGWTLYARRTGVQTTLSQAVPAFGLRRTRYRRKLAKTSLQHVALAIVMVANQVKDCTSHSSRFST